MRYAIDLDVSKCISCGACAVACMDQNDIDLAAGQKPFRNVFDMEEKKDGEVEFSHLSLACMHCTDAPCIVGCPRHCISKDPETNMTIYDTTRCVGCHSCAMACPFGVATFGPDNKMRKCTGCYVRVHNGLLPACVRVCPTNALQLVDLDAPDQIAPENSLRTKSLKMLKMQV